MNSNYNIVVFGDGDWYSLQIPRIIQGFRDLGHTVVSERNLVENFKPDFIYCNDPGTYDSAIEYQKQYGGKLIFNVLDIPWHDLNVDKVIDNLKNKLSFANAITTISKTTQNDLKKSTEIDSSVIYNPIKDVSCVVLNAPILFARKNTALFCGRANSPNKRFSLIINSFRHFNFNPNSLTVCGSENPQFGKYVGIIPDQYLNLAYNSSKLYLHSSLYEGLGLGMIEALVCGVPVVACNDCAASVEFCPPEMLCNPTPIDYGAKILEILNNYEFYYQLALKVGSTYKKQFDKKTIAANIISIYETL